MSDAPIDVPETIEAALPSAKSMGYERLGGRMLGEILMELGACTGEDIDAALDAQRGEYADERIGEVLVALERVSQEQIAKALGIQLEMPFLDRIEIDAIPDEFVQSVPITFARGNMILPLSMMGDSIIAAMGDPLNTEAADDLGMLLGARITPVVALPGAITEAINRAYDRATGLAHEAAKDLQSGDESDDGDLDAIDLIDEAGGDDAPIIRFVNALLRDAVKVGASDIHIESFERTVVVRNRIDGILYKKVEAPKQAQSPVIARVKIMSGLNIAEKRLPQDGRIRRKIAGKDIDVRVSTVPTAHGERVVMRILDRSSTLLTLEDLGMAERTHVQFAHLIERPHGILLVSGPTGSGKTTTLYAALSRINRPEINILTAEDPVEYQLPGIGQMQVNSKIDLTFASGLRSFLRQDPDVIMVGEIRDKETAEIAIQASLTGHLVLSTVHTNDSATSLTRLVDMGVEPFLVASSLLGVLAQRLIRTLCKDCKQPYTPTPEEAREIGIHKLEPGTVFYKEIGCEKCLNTGYRGRKGIYELLIITDQIRQMVVQNRDASEIKKVAIANGTKLLLDDGARNVLLGRTTAEEVLRVATDEDFVLEL